MAGDMQTKSGTEGLSHVLGPDGGAEGAERPARRRPIPARRAAAITAALAGIACLAAACSSPHSPHSPQSPARRPQSMAVQALAYSKCMRSHGIPDYPDPTIRGNTIGMKVGGTGDMNPHNPKYQAARQACRSLSPAANTPSVPSAQQMAADVRFGACMRSHGYPSFPDPDSHGVFNLPSAINQGSAQFTSASNTCQRQTNDRNLNMSQTSNGPG